MFTTGSKLFFGGTALSTVGAIVFAATNGGPTGLMATIGLVSLAIVFAFLAGINFANRDGNVPGMQEGVEYTSGAAQQPVGHSFWPLATAVGLGGLVVGAVSTPVVFKVSVVVLLAALVEWMVQGWAERASADGQYNAAVRRRLLQPLEFPILGALGLGAIVYSFSRVMLHIDKDAGKAIFGILGAIILGGGFLFATKRQTSRSTILGISAVALLGLMGAGVASAISGQRTIEAHPTTVSDAAVCLEPGTAGEVDDHAAQDVSAKSSVVANIFVKQDGKLVAFINGYPNTEYHELTVPRGVNVRVLFHNESGAKHRLTARLGTFGGAEAVSCTTAVNKGKEAFLDFKIPRSNAASTTPLVLVVPGLDGQQISVIVP